MSEQSKKCSNCKELKPLSEFHKNKWKKDGYSHNCRPCCKALKHRYYHKDVELSRKKQRERLKDPEYAEANRARSKKWYYEHKEQAIAKAKVWAQNHPELVKAKSKKWRETHKQLAKVRAKQWYEKKKQEMEEAWQSRLAKQGWKTNDTEA